MFQLNFKVGFVSFGCLKVLVDFECIFIQLWFEGYDIVLFYDLVDVVVVNICGFIDLVVIELLDVIGEVMNVNGKVIVIGCLGKCFEQIWEVYLNVLVVFGLQDYMSVMEVVYVVLLFRYDLFVDLVFDYGIKLILCYYVYLKIFEGCNYMCSFCIIFLMCGKLVLCLVDEVLCEVEWLVCGGVKELLVVFQDILVYGVDVKYVECMWCDKVYQICLKVLCEGLFELDVWICMYYVYLYLYVDEIVLLMVENWILLYLDILFQYVSLCIFKLMKCFGVVDKIFECVQCWCQLCLDIIVCLIFIVGFFGEIEVEFEDLLLFFDEVQLDCVGVFVYLLVMGVIVNILFDLVFEEVKQECLVCFMVCQVEIFVVCLEVRIGIVQQCLVDVIEDGIVVVCLKVDVLEIDGLVYIQNVDEVCLCVGQFVDVEIIESDEYDLYGDVLIDEGVVKMWFDIKVL